MEATGASLRARTADTAVALSVSLAARGHPRLAQAALGVALAFDPHNERLLRKRVVLAARADDKPTLIATFRRLLALRPDDNETFDNLVTLEVCAGHTDAARELLESHDRGKSLRLGTDALIDPERAASEGAYVAVLRDVEVETADWSILDRGKVYNAEAHFRSLDKSPLVRRRVSPDRRTVLFSVPEARIEVHAPCIHLGGDHNYSHWLLRNLIKLALLEGTPYADLPLLINEDLFPHQRAYLEMLGIPDARLIKVPRPALVSCRDLVVPTSLIYRPETAQGVAWLRRRLARWIDTGAASDLLYVSRRDARVRRLVNEAEVEDALLQLGFTSIVPGELSVPEQIAAFSRARVIVGPHGAGFANLVFARPGTRVLEINSTYKAHMRDHVALAEFTGMHFEAVLSNDYDATQVPRYLADTDFRVDVSDVLEALRELAPEVFAAGHELGASR